MAAIGRSLGGADAGRCTAVLRRARDDGVRCSGRTAAAARAFEALPHADRSSASPALPEDALAAPFCKALLAFACSDYAACVEWLVRVRHIAHRCGGSLAQCDLIHLTFTEAALRARKARLAGALVAERVAEKPTSQLNRLLLQRLRINARDRMKGPYRPRPHGFGAWGTAAEISDLEPPGSA